MPELDFFKFLATMGANFALNDINNGAAAQRERDARRENFEYNEMAANNSDMRTRKLYNDLYSPQAQIGQLENAGLSPSVYYNGGAAGMSGQAGAQGAGASGISPNIFGLGEIDFAQLAKTLAETDLIKEQANELRGENAMGNAKVTDLLAEAGYKKQSEALAKAEAEGQDLENYIRTQGMNAELYKIQADAKKAGYQMQMAFEEMEQAGLLTQFKKETLETEVAIRKQTLNELVQNILESKSRERLNNQQIEAVKMQATKLFNDITLGWAELEVENRRSESYTEFIDKRIELMPQELEATLKGIKVQERKMYIDAITDIVKSAGYAIMGANMYKGGNPVMTSGKGAGGKIPQGGNAVSKTRKGQIIDNKSIYDW